MYDKIIIEHPKRREKKDFLNMKFRLNDVFWMVFTAG